MDTEPKQRGRSSIGTRLLALATLATFVTGVGYVASQAYGAATDSFVAPIILSPDNDLVIANKLKMSELGVEHARAVAQLDAIDADLAAADTALARLRGLHATASNAVAWMKNMNARQLSAGALERSALARQRSVLTAMIDKQESLAAQAESNMNSGLISRTDYARELQALNQMKLALLDNDRATLQANLAIHQASLAERSLARRGGDLPMPELLVREDELVRIELEILKLESDQRAKAAERKIVQDKLARIQELEDQLRTRPIVRAMEHKMEVAFVPYTQLDGVRRGANVYDCVWGLFHCHAVGTVEELVPGEVVLPDPWGNQARGQYAVLTLTEHDSARNKTLRVRGSGAPAERPQPADQALTVR